MLQNPKFILIFGIVVFIIGGCLYLFNPTPVEYKNPNEPAEVFCTMDAKLCPDGTYVGRQGPKCEFAPCPTEASCEGGPCPVSTSSPSEATSTQNGYPTDQS